MALFKNAAHRGEGENAPAEFPLGSALGKHIEVEGTGDNRRLLICDVRSILKYDSDEIIVVLHREQLQIEGHGLICTSYFGRTIRICGKVTALRFSEAKA